MNFDSPFNDKLLAKTIDITMDAVDTDLKKDILTYRPVLQEVMPMSSELSQPVAVPMASPAYRIERVGQNKPQHTRGPLIKEEKQRRLRLFLKFIFLFRFVFKEQVVNFAKVQWGVNSCRRLLEYGLKEGYLGEFTLPYLGNRKIYFLLRKGLVSLENTLPRLKHRFRKERINRYLVFHHEQVIDAYLQLLVKFPGSRWVSEWILRIGKPKHVRLPDGLLVLSQGQRLAVELELTHKTIKEWKEIVGRFAANIKAGYCDGVLIIAQDSYIFRTIVRRLFDLWPRISGKYFFVTNKTLLAQGRAVQVKREVSLDQMVALLNEVENETKP